MLSRAVAAFIWISLWPARAKELCALFEFPTLPDRKITAKEHTSINVTFNLRTGACNNTEDIYVQIYHKSVKECTIEISNSSCIVWSNTSTCYCLKSSAHFLFSKTVDRNAIGTWRWSAFDDFNRIAKSVKIKLNIASPPLFAIIASHNVTTKVGQVAHFTIPVKTNVTKITQCQLRNNQPAQNATMSTASNYSQSSPANCLIVRTLPRPNKKHSPKKCACSLQRTPPGTSLSVYMYDVTKLQDGPWRVIVYNRRARGHVNFYLHVTDEHGSANRLHEKIKLGNLLIIATCLCNEFLLLLLIT